MQLATNRSAETLRAATESRYPPIELENRPHIETEQAAYYLLRKPQTLRAWAMRETYPGGLKPRRIGNRLGWPVDDIRRLLGVGEVA